MIILDTHIWIWWIDGNSKLTADNLKILQSQQMGKLGISIISGSSPQKYSTTPP
jgi:PIN domain nuclease of toxin-antitoxin system